MAIKRRSKVRAEFNMSSLTDIIFLLLIFFMLTSSFVSPNALKLLLPQSTSPALSKQTVTVSITEDIDYYVDQNEVAFSNLQSAVAKKLTGEEDETIVVAAHKTIPLDEVVKVMNIGKELDAQVILATEPE